MNTTSAASRVAEIQDMSQEQSLENIKPVSKKDIEAFQGIMNYGLSSDVTRTSIYAGSADTMIPAEAMLHEEVNVSLEDNLTVSEEIALSLFGVLFESKDKMSNTINEMNRLGDKQLSPVSLVKLQFTLVEALMYVDVVSRMLTKAASTVDSLLRLQ